MFEDDRGDALASLWFETPDHSGCQDLGEGSDLAMLAEGVDTHGPRSRGMEKLTERQMTDGAFFLLCLPSVTVRTPPSRTVSVTGH